MDRQTSQGGHVTGKVLVFAATYNERDNIQKLCETVLGLNTDYDMLVVDDNSPDGTGQLLDSLAKGEPRLSVVHRAGKLGVGSAHKVAMHYAIEKGYETLVTMDADFSHPPEDIPRLLENLAGADFVTGSRYVKGGSCDYTGYRIVVSVLANWGARLLLGIPLHEVTTSFRAFRVAFLRKVDLDSIQAHGYSYFMEAVFRLYCAGGRLKEIPFHFVDRTAGASKIPRFEIINGVLQLLRLAAGRLYGAKRAPGRD
ncbi:MAG: polyprenol monophosphomannose synthase [bacterium]